MRGYDAIEAFARPMQFSLHVQQSPALICSSPMTNVFARNM
jgi:hypothetical protein